MRDFLVRDLKDLRREISAAKLEVELSRFCDDLDPFVEAVLTECRCVIAMIAARSKALNAGAKGK
eukprot:6815340-Alexandrium_andersonii.AAC.1